MVDALNAITAALATVAAATSDDALTTDDDANKKQQLAPPATAPEASTPATSLSIIQDWRALSMKLSYKEFENEVALERKRRGEKLKESSSQMMVVPMEQMVHNDMPPPSPCIHNSNRKTSLPTASSPTSPAVAAPPHPTGYPLAPSLEMTLDNAAADEGPVAHAATTTSPTSDTKKTASEEPSTVEKEATTTRTDNELIEAIIAKDLNRPSEDVDGNGKKDEGDDDKKPAAVNHAGTNKKRTAEEGEEVTISGSSPKKSKHGDDNDGGAPPSGGAAAAASGDKADKQQDNMTTTQNPVLVGDPTLPPSPHVLFPPPLAANTANTLTPMQAVQQQPLNPQLLFQQLQIQQRIQQLLQQPPPPPVTMGAAASTPMQEAQTESGKKRKNNKKRKGGGGDGPNGPAVGMAQQQQQQQLLQMPLFQQQQRMFGFPGLLPPPPGEGGGLLPPPWMMTQPQPPIMTNPILTAATAAAATAGFVPPVPPNMMMMMPPGPNMMMMGLQPPPLGSFGGQMMMPLMPGGGGGPMSPLQQQQQQQQMQGLVNNNNKKGNNMTLTQQNSATSWDQKFQQLIAYKERFGHVDVSPTDGAEYLQLSRWLGTQRWRWNKAVKREDDGLSLEQIERLHNLGVTLHRTADQHARVSLRKKKVYGLTLEAQKIAQQKAAEEWNSFYTHLANYKNEYGHCKVPVTDKELYRWVAKQREQWKLKQSNDPKAQITPTQIEKLVQIGLGTSMFGPTNPRWDSMFNLLKKFKEEHGHLRVPSMEQEFAALYKWLTIQRVEWRKALTGDESAKLDQEQMDRLIDLGMGNALGPFDFVSEIRSKEWESMYNQLVEFHKEHGHAEVIERKEKDQYSALAAWMKTQRSSYLNRQAVALTGEKKQKKGAVMTDEQFKRLKALGMRMEPIKQPDFDTRFRQLADYIAVHGHSRVPAEYAESDYLGGWVRRTRQLYREDKLPQEQIVKLDMIGMDWRTRVVFPKKKDSF